MSKCAACTPNEVMLDCAGVARVPTIWPLPLYTTTLLLTTVPTSAPSKRFSSPAAAVTAKLFSFSSVVSISPFSPYTTALLLTTVPAAAPSKRFSSSAVASTVEPFNDNSPHASAPVARFNEKLVLSLPCAAWWLMVAPESKRPSALPSAGRVVNEEPNVIAAIVNRCGLLLIVLSRGKWPILTSSLFNDL